MSGAALRSDTKRALKGRRGRCLVQVVVLFRLRREARIRFESLLTRDQGDAIVGLPAAIDGSASLRVSHLDWLDTPVAWF